MQLTSQSTLKALIVAGALAGALVAVGTASTKAQFDQHLLDCLGWMITDPQMHAANCLPSRVTHNNDTLSPTSGGESSSDCIADDLNDGGLDSCDIDGSAEE